MLRACLGHESIAEYLQRALKLVMMLAAGISNLQMHRWTSSKKGRNPLIGLCDFGHSINKENRKPKTAVGTPGYTGVQAASATRSCSAY